ncbi:hypothetical protein Aperf_G00000089211 [Anoplocephala perfoliata]
MNKRRSGEVDRAASMALGTIRNLHQKENHGEAPTEPGLRKFTFFNAAVAEIEAEHAGHMELDTPMARKAESTVDGSSGGRSLFIFSESNLLRKAAKTLIDWGYPLNFGQKFLFPLNFKRTPTIQRLASHGLGFKSKLKKH